MPKFGDKQVQNLGISNVKVWFVSTKTTVFRIVDLFIKNFYLVLSPVFAQKFGWFTQAKNQSFYLLVSGFSPLSTRPITNTKLINKDLYS